MANGTGIESLLTLLASQNQQASPVTHTNGGTTNTWHSPLAQAKEAADIAAKAQKMQNDTALAKAKIDKEEQALADTISKSGSKSSETAVVPTSAQEANLPVPETALTSAGSGTSIPSSTPEINSNYAPIQVGSAMISGAGDHLQQDDDPMQRYNDYLKRTAYRNEFKQNHGFDEQGNPYEIIDGKKISYAVDDPRGQFIVDSLKGMDQEQEEETTALKQAYSFDPKTGDMYKSSSYDGGSKTLLDKTEADKVKATLDAIPSAQNTNNSTTTNTSLTDAYNYGLLPQEKSARAGTAEIAAMNALSGNTTSNSSGALKDNDVLKNIPEEWQEIYTSSLAQNIPDVPEMFPYKQALANMISRNSGATQSELDQMKNGVTSLIENMDMAFNQRAYLVGSMDDFDYTRKNTKASPAKVASDICQQMGYPPAMQQFIVDEINDLKTATHCSNNALVGMIVRNNIRSSANNGYFTREDEIADGYSWKRDWWGLQDNERAISQLKELMDPNNRNNYKNLSDQFLRINNVITDMQDLNPAYQKAQQALTRQISINSKWGNDLSDYHHKRWAEEANKDSLNASQAFIKSIYKNLIPAINIANELQQNQ